MKFVDILKLECCVTNFEAKDKKTALKNIAKRMKKSSILDKIDQEEIFESLKNREETGSTGFTTGIAIPHCQISGLKDFVGGIMISKNGIDFHSLDNKKSKIFIVIFGPKGKGREHLQLLAQISNTLKVKENRKTLLYSKTKINLYEKFIHLTDGKDIELNKNGKSKLMYLIVKNKDLMKDITEIFIQYNITQATVIESTKMENYMSHIPLFMGFLNFSSKKHSFINIITVVIEANKIKAVINSLEDLIGDLEHYKGLSVLVLDLLYKKGFF